jgi:hypothetical protein
MVRSVNTPSQTARATFDHDHEVAEVWTIGGGLWLRYESSKSLVILSDNAGSRLRTRGGAVSGVEGGTSFVEIGTCHTGSIIEAIGSARRPTKPSVHTQCRTDADALRKARVTIHATASSDRLLIKTLSPKPNQDVPEPVKDSKNPFMAKLLSTELSR